MSALRRPDLRKKLVAESVERTLDEAGALQTLCGRVGRVLSSRGDADVKGVSTHVNARRAGQQNRGRETYASKEEVLRIRVVTVPEGQFLELRASRGGGVAVRGSVHSVVALATLPGNARRNKSAGCPGQFSRRTTSVTEAHEDEARNGKGGGGGRSVVSSATGHGGRCEAWAKGKETDE